MQSKVAPALYHDELMAVFPELVRAITDYPMYHADHPEAMERYVKVLQYCVPDGKKQCATAFIGAYKLLEDADKLTPENMHLAYIMGWCIELLVTYFLIVDDIMDHSETRRGKPCWYKNDGIGFSGFTDAMLIEEGIYTILKRYFSGKPYYLSVVELFQEVTSKSLMGQSLDMLSNNNGEPNLKHCTMKKVETIAKHKTGSGVQLPVLLAMHVGGKYDTERHRQAEIILEEIGIFYQTQNEFLDYLGDASLTGKCSSDISEGKCTWFIATALQQATAEQKEILEANYGRSEPEAIRAVRKVYSDLNLRNSFRSYEEKNYNLIRTNIEQISKDVPHDVFFQILDRIYKRSS